MHLPLFQGERTKANFWIHERLCQYSAVDCTIKLSRARAERDMRREVEKNMRLIHLFSAIERWRGCLRVFPHRKSAHFFLFLKVPATTTYIRHVNIMHRHINNVHVLTMQCDIHNRLHFVHVQCTEEHAASTFNQHTQPRRMHEMRFHFLLLLFRVSGRVCVHVYGL